MSDAPTYVHALVDTARGLGLIRGRNVSAVLEVAGLIDITTGEYRHGLTYSTRADGWVIPTHALPAVEAAAAHLAAPMTTRKRDTAA